MNEKTVFITGATSFTGAHIARAFRDRGYQVTAGLTASRNHYENDPVLRERLAYCDPHVVVENCSFGSDVMIAALRKGRYGIFVNHGASIKGYRSVDFDYLPSVQSALHEAPAVFETLAASETKRFIHSATIFEADEGGSNAGMMGSAHAVSLYGASKSMVWDGLRFWAKHWGMPISKIVIPNPIGPLENADRLVPLFVKLWAKGDVPTIRTPDLVRDNLPASWLANVYVEEAELAYNLGWEASLASPRFRRPSGFVMSNVAFVSELAKKLRAHGFAHACEFKVEPTPTNEPTERFNTEHVKELAEATAADLFWADWCAWLLKKR